MYFLRSGIPFVRFLFIFIAGIFVGISCSVKTSILHSSVAFAVYIVCYYYRKKNLGLNFICSVLGYALLFQLGILLVNEKTEKNSADHFIHSIDSISVYKAKVVSTPEYTEKTIKVVFEVEGCKIEGADWEIRKGKILGYIRKDNTLDVKKGMVLLIKGKPSLPSANENPEQFDYATYLFRKNIYAVHFIKREALLKIEERKDFFILELADNLRDFCDEKLKAGIQGENEYRMTSALVLGVRAGLDVKLYDAYSSTGTVHALAVSGLHVSLIYFIVTFFLGFLKRIKYGKLYFVVLSVLIFWFYALVTGFSPSVVRAVAMFSIFLIANILKRNSGIYNTLAFSAFVILCFQPFWVFDIGFQFSFLAVVGIAYIYPIIYAWLTPKNWISEKLWAMIGVSLAAQIAVSPLSIYYFHSFPILFLPFNMLIVPVSSLALYTGLGGLMVYKIKIVSDFLFLVTEYLVRFMNYFVQLPISTKLMKADFLYLDPFELFFIYLFICFFFFALKNRNVKSFVFASVFLFVFMASTLYHTIVKRNIDSITVYKIKDNQAISLIHNGSALVLSDSLMTEKDKIFRYSIYNHLASERINNIIFTTFKDSTRLAIGEYSHGKILVWRGKELLLPYNKKAEELAD